MAGAIYGVGVYGVDTYGAGAGSLTSVSPTSLLAGSGTVTLTFTGTATTWLTTIPAITASAGILGARTATSDTTATATYIPPSSAQTVTFTDSTDNNTTVTLAVTAVASVTVVASALSAVLTAPTTSVTTVTPHALIAVSPGSVMAGSAAATITLIGRSTTWLTTAPTITASAGSMGALTVVTNTTATALYTPPAGAQNVTFTDVTDANTTATLLSVGVPPVIPPGAAGMAPAIVVEVSFTTNPQDPPIWVDVTRWVQGQVSIRRGRQRELDRVQSGVLTLDLDNRDRRFDPTYTSGAYYPNVLPMKRIRTRGTYASSSFPQFSGYIESWGQAWPSWQDAVVSITASDAFKPLNLAQLNQSFPVETSDQRVSEVLSAVGWTVGGPAWTLNSSLLGSTTVIAPTGDRVITPGMSMIQASTLANVSALQHLQDVVDTEMGLLYVDREGAVTFHGRNYVVNTISQGTFGEAAGEMPYVDLVLAYDDTNIWNDVEITRQGGAQQSAIDLVSQKQYYPRTLSKTSTLHVSDVAAFSTAQVMVQKYAQPSVQIIGMTLDGEANPAVIYPQMLGREIGDQVTVRRRPAWGGMIEQVSIIQGINVSYTVAGGIWSVVWRLSPASTFKYWTLNDPVLSILNTSTRLFF